MKITILMLGFLFGGLAIWALIELVMSRQKSAPKPQPRVAPLPPANLQSLVATDPFSVENTRRGVRGSLPPGQHLR